MAKRAMRKRPALSGFQIGIGGKAWRSATSPSSSFASVWTNPDEDVSVERMWVLVRERTTDGYLGILDNEPYAITENDEFWLGTELPFSAKHVIGIDERNPDTIATARKEPRKRWAG